MTRPICTACKHCRPNSIGAGFNLCDAPQKLSEASRLAGIESESESENVYPRYCDLQRNAGFFTARLVNKCGLECRWFKPKDAV